MDVIENLAVITLNARRVMPGVRPHSTVDASTLTHFGGAGNDEARPVNRQSVVAIHSLAITLSCDNQRR